MSKRFYRIRNLEKLLNEYNELENQEIFFQSSEKLNDPLERFMDFVFNGDKVVWKFFFKHYILCFEWIFQNYIIFREEDIKLTTEHIPIFKSFSELETLEYKKLITNITNEFFIVYEDLIDKISLRATSVKKDELLKYLHTLHLGLLEIIQRVYESEGLMNKREQFKEIDIIEDLIKEHGFEKTNKLHQNSVSWYENMMLTLNFNTNMYKNTPNKNFIVII
jgi:hypothetical protein